MTAQDWLAGQFEAHRTRLSSVAYRMLGSRSEAEDALQESWLRLTRSEPHSIENPAGWLTTVVARVCLDMLRSRESRREEPHGLRVPEHADDDLSRPGADRLLADSIGVALLIVLETLAPAERVAFVLHDLFDLPFEEIAPIVGRTPTAARQLASRARRRIQGGNPDTEEADLPRQRDIVDAFISASHGGDLNALLALLDPDVVLRADSTASKMGAPGVQGAEAVAKTFSGRAQGAQAASIDGLAGMVWVLRGVPRVVFNFTIAAGKIAAIDMLADPERLGRLDLELRDSPAPGSS